VEYLGTFGFPDIFSGRIDELITYKNRHLIIPVHPPKFSYLFNSFSGLNNIGKQSDVFLTLVTTSDIEKEMLTNYISVSGAKIPMSYEIVSAVSICKDYNLNETTDCIKSNRNKGIVNFKKMAAIQRAFNIGAEEVVCLDSDILFLSSIDDIFDRLKVNFSKKEIIAGNSIHAGPIVVDTANILLNEDSIKIIDLFDGGKLYSWFFDAPYYPKKETLNWLDYLKSNYGSLDAAFSRFTWGTFENMLFQMYCILHEGFKITDIRGFTGERVPEELWMSEVFSVIDNTGYVPVWADLGGFLSYISHSDLARARTTFMMAMHVDRIPARFD